MFGEQTVKDQVIDFLNTKCTDVKNEETLAYHTLEEGKGKSKANIVIRFASRKSKIKVLSQEKNLVSQVSF